MIKKVLSKSFMAPSIDEKERFMTGTGESRCYIYDRVKNCLIKNLPFAAEGCFNKTGNLIFFGKKYGGFALYNIDSDTLLLENKLPGNHREQPIMPICYYSNNILLFATEVKREKQIIKYYITENRFETILRGDRYYKLLGKMGDVCLGYYREETDDQMKINLIKINEDGEIASKIVDTDGSNTLLYEDKFYYLYQCQGNCYEIRCMDENFEECQIGYIKRKKSFFVRELCLNEKYIAFICKNRGDYETKSLIVYDRINETEIIEEKCPQFTMDLLLTKDTVYIGAMDALYCCELRGNI